MAIAYDNATHTAFAVSTKTESHSLNTTRSPADFAGHTLVSLAPVAAGFSPTPMMHHMLQAGGVL